MTGFVELPALARSPTRARVAQWLSQIASFGLFVAVLVQAWHATSGDMLRGLAGDALVSCRSCWRSISPCRWRTGPSSCRLWRLPIEGFPILVAKRISNELLPAVPRRGLFLSLGATARGLTTAPRHDQGREHPLRAGRQPDRALVLVRDRLSLRHPAGDGALCRLGGGLRPADDGGSGVDPDLQPAAGFTLLRNLLLWVSGAFRADGWRACSCRACSGIARCRRRRSGCGWCWRRCGCSSAACRWCRTRRCCSAPSPPS